MTLALQACRFMLRPEAARFERFLADPASAQTARLKAILQETADSRRGQELGLSRVATLEEFRATVPVVRPAELQSYFRRITAGEPNVLSRSAVSFVETSGGTSGSPKSVPFTQPMLDEMGAALRPWVAGMHARYRGLANGPHYWSISPVVRGPRTTEGGVPLGNPDDTQFFGRVTGFLLRRGLAVPPEVAGIEDVDAWRAATAHHLVANERLAFASVWSPSFLVLLIQAIEAALPQCLAQLPSTRAERIRNRLTEGLPLAQALWPHLQLVSCWTDGAAATFGRLDELRALLPGVTIEGKGLLATEGIVSIPWGGPAPVLAVASHFLEFRDLDGNPDNLLLAQELVEGRRYGVVLSTSAGLLRYDLGDVVQCIGRHAATPMVRFLGREGNISDLAGEKLDGVHVEAVLHAAERSTGLRPAFRLVAPRPATPSSPPAYRLYVEGLDMGQAARLAGTLEKDLRKDFPYRHCRDLGQLGPVEGIVAPGARARFETARQAQGSRLGSLKPVAFDQRPGWDQVLLEDP